MSENKSGIKKVILWILARLHLEKTVREYLRLYREGRAKKINKEKLTPRVNKLKELVHSISDAPMKDTVYIFQYTFFDPSGTHYYSGGAERYMCDLAQDIKKRNCKIILFQIGNPAMDVPWVNEFADMHVVGINAGGGEEYFYICSELPEPKLAIYSGFIDWGQTFYKNSVLISHGITWDAPLANADSQTLMKILNRFSMLISVDVNTISWFRSTFSHDLANSEVLFKYIPNYVDTHIFTPNMEISGDSVKITFPRRLCKERGFWLFAPVAKQLLEKYKHVLIEFVGFVHDEDIALYLEELKTAYGERVSNRVVAADLMHEVYRDTDVSVIPTLYAEGTSLSCLEAMACGNCVVSTNVGGLGNLILPDFNGKLINPDADELFDALCSVIDNPAERKRLQKNAAHVALAFSKEIWVKRWGEIFNRYLPKYC